MDFRAPGIDSHVRLSRLVAPASTGEIIMMRMCINDEGVSLAFGMKVISEVKLDWWIRFLGHERDHVIGRSRDHDITIAFLFRRELC